MRYSIIAFILFCFSLNAQDILKTGRNHLNVLAADDMYGRGYVNNGYEKAVNYVENEFKSFGLVPVGKSFRQSFVYPVNTFPDSVAVGFGNKRLVAGKDFIVFPESGSDKGTFKPVYYTINKLFLKYEPAFTGREIVVIEPIPAKMNKDSLKTIQFRIAKFNSSVPVIQLTKSKLTWSVADEALPHAKIEIKAELFDSTVNEISLDIHSKVNSLFQSYNVIGMMKAKKKKCSDYVVITAHLDHLGMMGSNAIFNGANDNASGISMLLTLAEHYAKTKPSVNVVFIAFGGEEAGLIGSKYFTQNPLIPLDKIKFLLNIDLMGTGEDGITVVNATKFGPQFDLLKKINADNNYLKLVKPRGEAANSDHYWFTQKGVPSFFIYTMGGTTAYHDVFDRPEQLPFTEFEDLYNMIVRFLDKVPAIKN